MGDYIPHKHQAHSTPHEGPTRHAYFGSKHPGRTRQPRGITAQKGRAIPNDTIVYLLKLAPREVYIDDLMDGRLYMNAAGYYQGLPGEQGDLIEASIVPGVRLYGNYRLPIYCMYTVRENDTVNNCVHIPMRMILEFGCADGLIGIVRYDSFARLASSHIADGGSIYAHGAISHGTPRTKADRRDVPRHDLRLS